MIKLNDVEISDEEFAKVAEQQGYEKKYEYPLVMRNTKNGDVWEFSDLFSGICLVAGGEGSYVGEKCDKLVEHTNSIWKPCERPTKLYDGLTAEQWQQVIDDKLLVKFSCTKDFISPICSTLRRFDTSGSGDLFIDDATSHRYKHCSIHPSQPQFGGRAEWVKDDDWIAVRYEDGMTGMMIASAVPWEDVVRWQVVNL